MQDKRINTLVNQLLSFNVPLADEKIEREIIGIIVDRGTLQDDFFLNVQEDDFSNLTHRNIFKFLEKLWKRYGRFDLATIQSSIKSSINDEIRLTNQDFVYILDCNNSAGSPFAFDADLATLKELSQKRKIIDTVKNTIALLLTDKGCCDIATETIEELGKIALDIKADRNVTDLDEALDSLTEIVKKNMACEKEITGIPTPFYRLNENTKGFQEGELVIICADTSQGKSALALCSAVTAIQAGYAGVYYSFEMLKEQLAARVVAVTQNDIDLNSQALLKGKLGSYMYTKYCNAVMSLYGLPLYFDDTVKGQGIDNLIRSIKAMKAKRNIRFAIIDYLQIIPKNDWKGNTEQFYATATSKLKQVALQEKITIICLSQLNRDKIDHDPTRERILGASAIANDADIILAIYRPKVYNEDLPDYIRKDYLNAKTEDTAIIKVLKNRTGDLCDFLSGFNGTLTKFYDYQGEIPQPHKEEIPQQFSEVSKSLQDNSNFDIVKDSF